MKMKVKMKMNRLIRRIVAMGFCLGVCASLMTSSCSKNLDHCWWRKGDATCDQIFNGTRPYCTTDARPCRGSRTPYGCVAEVPPTECHSPCGEGKDVLECEEEESATGGPGESETETGAALMQEEILDLAEL